MGESGSLEASLRTCVGLLCKELECSAGLVLEERWPSDTSALITYGSADQVSILCESLRRNAQHAGNQATNSPQVVSIPLTLANREVGAVWLARDCDAEWRPDVQAGVEVLKAVLATLLKASNDAEPSLPEKVLGQPHFLMQLTREVARSERQGLQFSLVLVSLAAPQPVSDPCQSCRPWSDVGALGSWLAERLRTNDVVGLMSPTSIGILLPDTGSIGARIALGRLEALFPSFPSRDGDLPLSPEAWTGIARCYPQDGTSAEALIDSALAGLSGEAGNESHIGTTDRLTPNFGGG